MPKQITTTEAGNLPDNPHKEIGDVSAAERAKHELQASFAMAKQFPRDETAAYAKIVQACKRPGFAGEALYSFPRGRGKVEGPSVNLAREMARIFGNIAHGCNILSMDDEFVHIEGYAIDLETNTWVKEQGKFKRLIYRRGEGWIQPDERDFRELVNRHGAIHTRNCILRIMPRDFIDDAMATAKETTRKVAAGQIERSREQTIRALVTSFQGLAVSKEMLEDFLGHAIDDVDAEEIVELRAIYKSIQDGNSKRDEYFNLNPSKGETKEMRGSISMDDLTPGDPPEPRKREKQESRQVDKGKDEGEPSEVDIAFEVIRNFQDQMGPTQFAQIISQNARGKTDPDDLTDLQAVKVAEALKEADNE